MELRTKHGFKEDPTHGNLLEKYRVNLFNMEDVDSYNKRHLSLEHNLSMDDILDDEYIMAVKDN